MDPRCGMGIILFTVVPLVVLGMIYVFLTWVGVEEYWDE